MSSAKLKVYLKNCYIWSKQNISNMDYKFLNISKDNNILTIKINSPSSLNALNSQIIDELNHLIESLYSLNDLRCVIITGEGRAFVAGADIQEMSNMGAKEGKEFGKKGAYLFRKIEKLPVPVIAAVNGFALGGGCELALSCDIRIASQKAKFGQPEVSLGIIPGFSGTQRLPRIIGVARAKYMIYTGEVIDATKALEWGIISEVVPPENLMERATDIANKIASQAPIAVRYSKEAINIGIECDTSSAIEYETNLFGLCFATEDQKDGMRAFINKESIDFKNR